MAAPSLEPVPDLKTREAGANGSRSGRRPAPAWLVPALIFAVAAALRVAFYAARRSFWIDESMLALNIGSRTFHDLARPLDLDQTAPLLFLWAERLLAGWFGVTELALRFLPLVAGIAVVPLTYRVASRVADREVAAGAAGIVGLAPVFVYFSNELKPYSSDAAIALVLILLALDWLDAASSSRAMLRLAAAGVLAVWASASAVFVLAAIGLAGLVGSSARPSSRRTVLLMGTAWLASFGMAYHSTYRASATSAYMRDFWGAAYLTPWGPGVLERWYWTARELFWGGMLGHASASGWEVPYVPRMIVGAAVALAVACAVAGIRRVARDRGAACALLLVGPATAALIGSAFRFYPTPLRLVLFAVPPLVILVASGIEVWLRSAWGPRWLRSWRTVGVLLLLGPGLTTLADVTRSQPRDHLRPLIAELRHRRQPGEPVYLSAGVLPTWAVYTTDWRVPDTVALRRVARLAGAAGPAFVNHRSRHGPVRDTVSELAWPTPSGEELAGLYPGIHYRAVAGFSDSLPDPGWLEVESARIRGAAIGPVWLLVDALRWPSECLLLERLREMGGRETYRRVGNEVGLFRFDFRAASSGGALEPSASAPLARSGTHEAAWLAACPAVPRGR